jgi:hypothetical protein
MYRPANWSARREAAARLMAAVSVEASPPSHRRLHPLDMFATVLTMREVNDPGERRHQLDLAGRLLVSRLLVIAGQAQDAGVFVMTVGLRHTVAGPLPFCPGPWPDLQRTEMSGYRPVFLSSFYRDQGPGDLIAAP